MNKDRLISFCLGFVLGKTSSRILTHLGYWLIIASILLFHFHK